MLFCVFNDQGAYSVTRTVTLLFFNQRVEESVQSTKYRKFLGISQFHAPTSQGTILGEFLRYNRYQRLLFFNTEHINTKQDTKQNKAKKLKMSNFLDLLVVHRLQMTMLVWMYSALRERLEPQTSAKCLAYLYMVWRNPVVR